LREQIYKIQKRKKKGKKNPTRTKTKNMGVFQLIPFHLVNVDFKLSYAIFDSTNILISDIPVVCSVFAHVSLL
jgi:hypothetical protein